MPRSRAAPAPLPFPQACFASACAASAPMLCSEAPPPAVMRQVKPMPVPSPPPPTQEAAAPQPKQPERPEQPEQPPAAAAGGPAGSGGTRDLTAVPKELDERFEKLDSDSAVRPTIINPGETWQKRAQKALLAAPTTSTVGTDQQKKEKDAAFDLLDALTKSGALSVEHASLHVVVAATHCFDKTVTETVVQDNTNPIAKVERSTLIMAGTIHQKPVPALLREGQLERVTASSPMLFLEDEGPATKRSRADEP